MAHYQARGRLHLADSRDQAAENAVQIWAQLTEHHGIRQVALIADASNKEIDRLNARIESLRLAYGQHVYRQQGATVDRAVVLTGGWQTSKETAYVQATHARHGTDWHLARDQLGEEGQDPIGSHDLPSA